MKLMFVIPRTSGGGAEKVLISLASHLAERHKVYLVSLYPPVGISYPLSERIIELPLYQERRIIREQKLQQKLKQSSLWKDISGRLPFYSPQWAGERLFKKKIQALIHLKKRYHIDCIISFLNPANYLAVMARQKTPAIISIRSFPEGEFSPPEAQTLKGRDEITYSCRKASRIVCVSREIAGSLLKSFDAAPEKTEVIYNPCDIERIRAESRMAPSDRILSSQIEKAEFVFFSNGRLTLKKGQWHLIRAFREVVDKHPGTVLIILGREQEPKTLTLLQQTIRMNRLENNVFLPGFYLNPFPYLAKAHAFVMSSLNEGFPNSIMEAMALGLPVISTDCRSGPREILAPNTPASRTVTHTDCAEFGILTPVCSGNQDLNRGLEEAELFLADGMLRVMEEPALRKHYARKSLERAAQFDKHHFIEQWESLIHKAITDPAGNLD